MEEGASVTGQQVLEEHEKIKGQAVCIDTSIRSWV
jgi:hypothetical protein